MHYFLLMAVLNSRQNIPHNNSDFVFIKTFFTRLNMLYQLASFNQIQDKIKRIIRFINFIEMHAMFVINLIHHIDFINNWLLSVSRGEYIIFAKCFDCKLFKSFLFDSGINLCEMAFANHFLYIILFVKIILD